MTKDQIKKAIESGSSFSVDGRPVTIWNGYLVIEMKNSRGNAFLHFKNDDIAKLKQH